MFNYNLQFKTISSKKMITKLKKKEFWSWVFERSPCQRGKCWSTGRQACPSRCIHNHPGNLSQWRKTEPSTTTKVTKKSTLECPPPQQDQPSEDISRSTEQPCDQKMWWHKDHKKDESRNNTCLLGVQRVAAARLWVRVTPCLMLLLSNALGKSDWRCCLVPIANTVHNIQATSHCTDECLPC